MNRTELDRFVAHYNLPAEHVERSMQLAGARPSATELREALRKFLQIGGVLSLCAGVIFFIAANWDVFGAFGRFAIVEILLVVSIVVAWISPPITLRHRLGTLSAFVLTGALLALFGQTYQTGADVYELFFMWSLFGLPFVAASRWWANWALWLCVLNLALLLFCGFVPGQGILWAVFARWNFTPALLVLGAAAINLAIWWLSEQRIAERLGANSSWVSRLAVCFAAGYTTWAGVWAIDRSSSGTGSFALTWVLVIAMLGSIVFRSFLRKQDVLPLTSAVASGIILGATFIGEQFHSQLGVVFLMAMWLIGTATLSGRWLTRLHRDWRPKQRVDNE